MYGLPISIQPKIFTKFIKVENGSELAKGERLKGLIESRGEGAYLVCHPSPGYEQVQGDLTEINFITIEERQ